MSYFKAQGFEMGVIILGSLVGVSGNSQKVKVLFCLYLDGVCEGVTIRWIYSFCVYVFGG